MRAGAPYSRVTMKPNTILIDPKQKFALSPNLYMQFMEPLGTTDGSVEAAWNHLRDDWREDVIRVTQELAPPLLRWGGCVSSFYRWREGVGPRDRRKPMHNLCWGGMETNQIGTHEFVDFCRRVGAQPFYCVNFESDGRQRWAHPPKGGTRSAGPAEAAAWVDYCNNPNNALRRQHGAPDPFDLKLWQIGNETSYDKKGYDCETAGRRTVAFAVAMRKVDSDLELIGWGDSGWAPRMLELCGKHIQYIAFHQGPGTHESLHGYRWRENPACTWKHLMQAYRHLERKIRTMREQIAGWDGKLAMTEGHFSMRARNRGALLSSWAIGVANARCLNVLQRNGDLLKIATLADFCGTRWQCNAIMIPTPRGQAYMMPVARVMCLYRRHMGRKAVDVARAPKALDVVASRTGSRMFVNVVNTSRTQAVPAALTIEGRRIAAGKVYEIAQDAMSEIDRFCPDRFAPVEKRLPTSGNWTFPPASVTAVALRTQRT